MAATRRNPSHDEPEPLALNINFLDPENLRLYRDEEDRLLLEIKDKVVYIDVSCRLAFPISDPTRYLELRDEGGEPIGMVERIAHLDRESRKAFEEEIRRSYFVPRIIRVEEMKRDIGALRFEAETDRGPVKFFVLNAHEDITHLSDGRVRIQDGFKNIYEILPWELDATSRQKVERII